MLLWTLNEIESAVRASWCRETCDPAQTYWSKDNPARGQCAVTALVLHNLLGGEVLVAEAWNADGSRQGFHYWNRLAGGVELDLTREQFLDGESLSRRYLKAAQLGVLHPSISDCPPRFTGLW